MNQEIKKYLGSVKSRLNLPRDIRNRLLSDLQTTIAARMEQGETWQAIRASLGTPAQVAAEYARQMEEYTYRKSPWRFAFLAAAVLTGLGFVYDRLISFLATCVVEEMASIGVIGGADGPTAVFVTSSKDFSHWLLLLAFLLSLLCYLRLRKCKQKET